MEVDEAGHLHRLGLFDESGHGVSLWFCTSAGRGTILPHGMPCPGQGGAPAPARSAPAASVALADPVEEVGRGPLDPFVHVPGAVQGG